QLFLLNRTAAEKLAIEGGVTPEALIGEVLVMEPEYENEEFGYGFHHVVDGIIDDYKYFSLKYEHQPLMLSVYREMPWAYEMLVKIADDQPAETLTALADAYTKVVPNRPFTYEFLTDRLNNLYRAEQRSVTLLSVLCSLTVILALFGLGGVVSFLAWQRKKEMGVRRVLGASSWRLLLRFNQEFLVLLTLATLLVGPVVTLLARRWLADFAFRIEPGISVICSAAVVVGTVMLVVISWQAQKVIRQCPAKVLRKE
ncbi:MAG: FtsX-like permease family protein, partial [Bacteroidota bacterium]